MTGHPALGYSLSMIFSENRCPLFGIMLYIRRIRADSSRSMPSARRTPPTMIDRILTVGGYTLVSRVTGFLRDVVMAAVLGAGPVADAFLVAFRLPNHFRAIFAEGAFSAAFVPAYARLRAQHGPDPARLFADRIFSLILATQLVMLALALALTPAVIRLIAPGFGGDPARLALAV